MKKLANREEQIMQVLWELDQAFVKEIIAELPTPKPHYNTVSTIIRILEDKGFVDHESFGNAYRYFPKVSIDSKISITKMNIWKNSQTSLYRH